MLLNVMLCYVVLTLCWADVAPGDAVVALSRKDIYRARKVSCYVLFCVMLCCVEIIFS
jgi:hypothetical protein